MNFPLNFVDTAKRVEWIKKKFPLKNTIFMGDGIFDHLVMKESAFSIAQQNAGAIAKKYSYYVTKRSGGDRAVAEACIYIMKRFFHKKI